MSFSKKKLSKSSSSNDDDEEEKRLRNIKPFQSSLTCNEYLSNPAVSAVLNKGRNKWTKKEKQDYAKFMSNRQSISVNGSDPNYSLMMNVVREAEQLCVEDEQFGRACDPYHLLVIYTGVAAFPQQQYRACLDAVNRGCGGAAQAGGAGQPIRFHHAACDTFLDLNSDETLQRVIGSLLVSFPGAMRLVRIVTTHAPTDIVC